MTLAQIYSSLNNTTLLDSIDTSFSDKNAFLNSKLICNKEDKKEKMLNLIERAYEKLKPSKIQTNSFIDVFYVFNREESFNVDHSSNSINCKVYSVFPNCNFEIKQIKNLPLSNTQLNKYLVNKVAEMPGDKSMYKSGFFAMSQCHRLIALKDDTTVSMKNSQSLKQILFGIWINLKEESPSPKKIDLDNMFEKHKQLIYERCFNFVQLTSKIDTVYSPSPDQGVFLLVIFYKDMQCHYEVKMYPNEEEKMNDDTCKLLSNFSSNWIISKSKYCLNKQTTLDIDLSQEIFNSRILAMTDYLEKKTGINQKSFLTKSTNTNRLTNSKISGFGNYQDNLDGIFEDTLEIGDNDYYNLPLMMPKKSNNDLTSKNYTKKKTNEVSVASTNSHSYKQSMNSIGKNSNQNSNELIAIDKTYNTVMEQGENIKSLENQVNKLELGIKNVLEMIKNMDNKKETTTSSNFNLGISNSFKRSKNSHNNRYHTTQREEPKQKVIDNDLSLDTSSKVDYTKIGDKSFRIPKIVYQANLIYSEEEDEV